MPMSKKHYIAVAAILASHSEIATYGAKFVHISATIAHELADYFAKDNPNFNRSRFLTACGILTEAR